MHDGELVVPVSPARRAAYEVVRRVRESDAYAPQVLDQVLSGRGLTAEDAAFATRLARGTLASVGTLDEALDRFIAKPGALEPQVRDALRVTAYELLYARTPARAAVHQGVEAVRSLRPQAAGLANAVLRRLAEAAPDFPWGDPEADLDALARSTAHPRWLVERLVAERGHDAARAALEADNEPAPLYLAHMPFAGTFEAALAQLTIDGAEPVRGPLPGSIVAGRASAAVRGEAVAAGLVLVADAGAQFAPIALAPHPGDVVVDTAAGRGTKTALLQAAALRAGGPAHIYALDIHAFKTEVLRKRMASLGVPEVTVLVGDATDLATVPGLPEKGTADAVLVDAPCSGLGALRRHPEKRWRVTPEQISELAALQRALLAEAAWLVRPGGVVVYSTCTILREENDAVVSAFLAGVRGAPFRVRSLAETVPPSWTGYITPEGFFQSLPAAGGPDGHFVAVLEHM
jgi:16S rRNA (cytosine967-C5)-methyltransferase